MYFSKENLSCSEEHGGVIEEAQRKPEDESRNLADVKENNKRLESFEKVEDNNEDVCRDRDREKTENKEWLLQLEKDAGEAVARAAEAVSGEIEAGWQKLRGSKGGTRRKVWTWTKILSPNIRYFVPN